MIIYGESKMLHGRYRALDNPLVRVTDCLMILQQLGALDLLMPAISKYSV